MEIETQPAVRSTRSSKSRGRSGTRQPKQVTLDLKPKRNYLEDELSQKAASKVRSAGAGRREGPATARRSASGTTRAQDWHSEAGSSTGSASTEQYTSSSSSSSSRSSSGGMRTGEQQAQVRRTESSSAAASAVVDSTGSEIITLSKMMPGSPTNVSSKVKCDGRPAYSHEDDILARLRTQREKRALLPDQPTSERDLGLQELVVKADLSLDRVRKKDMFAGDINDDEKDLINTRVEQKKRQYQEFERREMRMKVNQVMSMLNFVTRAEAEYAIKEQENDENEAVSALSDFLYLTHVRHNLCQQHVRSMASMVRNEGQRKRTGRTKTTGGSTKKKKSSTNESSYVRSRLRLDDALKKKDSFEGWSPARIRAYACIDTNPNAYYYRFNAPGEPQANGAWKPHEQELFYKRVAQLGVNGQWGIFSMAIPGRVGYQCSNFYRNQLEKGIIKDPNYYLDDKGKAHFIFAKDRRRRSGVSELSEATKNAQHSALVKQAQEQILRLNSHGSARKRGAGSASSASSSGSSKHAAAVSALSMDTLTSAAAAAASMSMSMSMSVDVGAVGNVSSLPSGPALVFQTQRVAGEKKPAKKGRKKRSHKRRRDEVEEEEVEDEYGNTSKRMYVPVDSVIFEEKRESNPENPLPGFVDPITLEEVEKPAISPYGHVMDMSSWINCLNNMATKNVCPLTKKPLTKRQLVVLTHDNIDEYRDKICNMV